MLSEFWEGTGFGVFAALTVFAFRAWRLERRPGALGATVFYAFVSVLFLADGTLFDHRREGAALAVAFVACLLTVAWQTRRRPQDEPGEPVAQR